MIIQYMITHMNTNMIIDIWLHVYDSVRIWSQVYHYKYMITPTWSYNELTYEPAYVPQILIYDPVYDHMCAGIWYSYMSVQYNHIRNTDEMGIRWGRGNLLGSFIQLSIWNPTWYMILGIQYSSCFHFDGILLYSMMSNKYFSSPVYFCFPCFVDFFGI